MPSTSGKKFLAGFLYSLLTFAYVYGTATLIPVTVRMFEFTTVAIMWAVIGGSYGFVSTRLLMYIMKSDNRDYK